ncbi:MAG: hypothetical protein RLZZ331_1291, partial [Pseudomonadota bacterium]
MIAEGGWVLAKVDARGNRHFVDPYSITAIASGVVQINILEYPTRAGA